MLFIYRLSQNSKKHRHCCTSYLGVVGYLLLGRHEDVGEYGDDDWETIRYDHVDVGDHSLLLIVYDRFIAIVIGTSNWRSD